MLSIELNSVVHTTLTKTDLTRFRIIKLLLAQGSPYQAVTGKIYCLKQQQATVLTACNLLMVY